MGNRLLYETIQFSPFVWAGDFTLARQFEAAASAGFDGVGLDIWSIDRHVAEGGTVGDIGQAFAESGIPCVELQAISISDEAATMEMAERFVELIDVLAPEVVMVGAGGTGNEIVDRLGRVADMLGGGGARFAIEFMPMGAVNDIATTVGITSGCGDAVGVCLDSWHFFRGADTWATLDALAIEDIAHVQFNDALPLESDDLMYETLQRRTLPGDGEFDVERFSTAVKDKGYTGPVAVELMSAPLRELGFAGFAEQAIGAARPYWS